METMIGCKPTDHKPVVYTLPKNTSLESAQKLDSIVDIGRMQVLFCHVFSEKKGCMRTQSA